MRKAQTIFTLAIFAIALFSGLASAVISVSGTTTNLAQESGFVVLTISSTENETVTLSIEDIESDMDLVDFNLSETSLILDDSNSRTKKVNLSYIVQSGFNFELTKEYSTTLNISGNESGFSTKSVTMAEDFCEGTENIISLDVTIDEINVESGFGDEGDFWYLMDEVSVEVLIEDGKYDIEDVELEWELYTTAGEEIDSGKENVADIDRGDDETAIITFKLNEKIEDFYGEDAILYVRVLANINDKDADNDDEEGICSWDNEEVKIQIDDDFVITTDIKFNQNEFEYYYEASCGEEITLTGEIWNIGADRQKDFYVEVYSNSLNIYEKFEFDELDEFENEDFSLTFKIPEDADEGISKITIEVFDDDNDLYENSEDDVSSRVLQVKIPESCITLAPEVKPELLGEALSGKEIVVKSIITNENNKDVTYTITAQGYDSWAKLVEITPQVITLSAGESQEFRLVLDANSDAIGEKTFEIQALFGGETFSQPVTVNIEDGQFEIKDFLTKQNLQIAGIVLLNLILLVAIIVVAKKVLKR